MRISVAYLCTLQWLAGFVLGDADEFKIVCYYSSWAAFRKGDGAFSISDADPTLCTHLIYSLVTVTEDGDVAVLDEFNDLPDNYGNAGYQRFIGLRNLSPKTKFMVSIGGASQGSKSFSTVMASPSLMSNLVENVVNFTLKYDFDGFDVDWEYPNQDNACEADVENFVVFLKKLRGRFDQHDLILSAAVGPTEITAGQPYDIPEISKYLDFINLMTYDFHGAWYPMTAGHNAPLFPAARETTAYELVFNVDASVNYWLDHGAPREKLILGVAFYGRSYVLNSSLENNPGSPITGVGLPGAYTVEPGMLAYYEICGSVVIDLWTTLWDKEQRVPYAYLEDQWVSFDNVKSITEKANYVKEKNLGGAMVWTIDMDDVHGICRERYPLLTALNRVLRTGCSASCPMK